MFGESDIFHFSSKKGPKGGQKKYRVKPTVGYRFAGGVCLNGGMINEYKDKNEVLEHGSDGVGSAGKPMFPERNADCAEGAEQVQSLKFEVQSRPDEGVGEAKFEDLRLKSSFSSDAERGDGVATGKSPQPPDRNVCPTTNPNDECLNHND